MSRLRGRAAELGLVLALFLLAVAVRWPHLWSVPRFTDELQEILWSFAIARGEILPLTAVDSYYGPLWSYLLAGLFLVFGFSPELPRLTAMLLGAGTVVLTYGLGRELLGRGGGALAAALLATSGGHVVINSHTARSNSITPLLTTGALWLLWRACTRGSGWQLAPAGFLLGLALQTHLSVVALAPGVALFVLVQRPGLLRSPWPYAAVLAALLGYANMLAFNLQSGFWSFRHARSLQEGYTGGRGTDLDYYLTNLGTLLQSLSRLLSGTIDAPDSPARFVYTGLALIGLLLLARRGVSLPLVASLSIVLVLPYFNPRYGPILSGRYLIPILPLAFVGIAAVALRVLTARRRDGGTARTPSLHLSISPSLRPAVAAAALALVLFPLLPLRAYYQEVLAEGRTNAPLYALTSVIVANRQADELVLLDEGTAQEQLGAGGTDFKAYRMLLEAHRVPYEVAKVGEEIDDDLAGGARRLILMESKKRDRLPRGVRATALGPEVASASGSDHRYGVYRLSLR